MRFWAAVLLGLAGWGNIDAYARSVVGVVHYPLAFMAERLGGGQVDVFYPVPPEVDPTYWRPGLQDISRFQQADVIALNGAGFAKWTARTTLPRSRIVNTSKSFEDRYIVTKTVTHSHGDGGTHAHDAVASYTWLDFALAAKQAEALAKKMGQRISSLKPEIENNAKALKRDLLQLNEKALSLTSLFPAEHRMIATHPRYQYFARAYSLNISSVSWDPGAMPNEEQWSEIKKIAAQTGAKIMLWEAQPPAEA
jgi:ABC-type metal ion transport system, periplasmic component/surface adhesin